jgi:hypothetical protein
MILARWRNGDKPGFSFHQAALARVRRCRSTVLELASSHSNENLRVDGPNGLENQSPV